MVFLRQIYMQHGLEQASSFFYWVAQMIIGIGRPWRHKFCLPLVQRRLVFESINAHAATCVSLRRQQPRKATSIACDLLVDDRDTCEPKRSISQYFQR